MTGCKDANAAITEREVDARVGQIVPEVISLLQRVTNVEPVVVDAEGTGITLSSPLTFPNGIGTGEVVAEIFLYRDAVRLDVQLEHNRVFAKPDGSPTERRCYLNDYVASVTLDAEALPTDFVRSVVAGITAAREAVRRHNRRASVPWTEVRVAARSPSEESVSETA